MTTDAPHSLEPIEEDETDVLAQLANSTNLKLQDSKFASRCGLRYPAPTFKPKIKHSGDIIGGGFATGWMDDIVAKFHEANLDIVNKVTKSGDAKGGDAGMSSQNVAQSKLGNAKSKNNTNKGKRPSASELSETTSVPAEEGSSATNDELDRAVPKKVSQHVESSLGRPMSPEISAKFNGKTAVVPASSRVDPSSSKNDKKDQARAKKSPKPGYALGGLYRDEVVGANPDFEEDEDREQFAHFKPWEKPTPTDRLGKCATHFVMARLIRSYKAQEFARLSWRTSPKRPTLLLFSHWFTGV